MRRTRPIQEDEETLEYGTGVTPQMANAIKVRLRHIPMGVWILTSLVTIVSILILAALIWHIYDRDAMSEMDVKVVKQTLASVAAMADETASILQDAREKERDLATLVTRAQSHDQELAKLLDEMKHHSTSVQNVLNVPLGRSTEEGPDLVPEASREHQGAADMENRSSQESKRHAAFIEKNRKLGLEWVEKYGPKQYPQMMAECRSFFENMSFETNPSFTSQCFQDHWLYNYVFAPLMEKGLLDKTYIDVGTHDYRKISNLYVFDVCLGFRGVCGEPKEEKLADIRKYRRCELIDSCISDKEEVMEFLFHGGESGLASTHNVGLKSPGLKKRLTCRPLQPVLEKANISYVSFMSLDVEGGEFKVLGSIDHTKTTIGLLLWEVPVDHENRQKVMSYAKTMGYEQITLPNGHNPVPKDYVFVHHTFPMQPENILQNVEYRCSCVGCTRI